MASVSCTNNSYSDIIVFIKVLIIIIYIIIFQGKLYYKIGIINDNIVTRLGIRPGAAQGRILASCEPSLLIKKIMQYLPTQARIQKKFGGGVYKI